MWPQADDCLLADTEHPARVGDRLHPLQSRRPSSGTALDWSWTFVERARASAASAYATPDGAFSVCIAIMVGLGELVLGWATNCEAKGYRT